MQPPIIESFGEFQVTYLTETVNLDPARNEPARTRGLVTFRVWAKHAEDAIARLRAQTPIEYPIVEIASVAATGTTSEFVIFPPEWGVVGAGSKVH